MLIGVPTEIKANEKRVGLVPESVRELTARGHVVIVQTGAGNGIGMPDAAYEKAGATIVANADYVFGEAEMIVKVKEPQPVETAQLSRGQVLFTYLHLAPDPQQADGLLASGCAAIAYETITAADGSLPLLAPMSEVAGRMATQVAAHYLENAPGGAGVLMGGVPGVAPARVAILGGGVSGSNALRIAVGMGADVTVLDRNPKKLREIDALYQGRVRALYASLGNVEDAVVNADAVIGAVLVPGAKAPKLVTRAHLKKMRPGSVFVDVAIDQGGCAETSKATTHNDPVFTVDGITHYCVANMPGGVARTAAQALNNATLPFVLALADKGLHRALADDPHFLAGLNVMDGVLTHEAVAHDLDRPYRPAAEMISLKAAA